MSGNIRRRLERLERRPEAEPERPAYLVIDEGELAQAPAGVKLYIRRPGFEGPDTWDQEEQDEQDQTAARAAGEGDRRARD